LAQAVLAEFGEQKGRLKRETSDTKKKQESDRGPATVKQRNVQCGKVNVAQIAGGDFVGLVFS
jgi:hypothetical protein